MFLSVKLSFGLTIEALGNNLSTVISICVGGVIYLIATLALGGIDKEELLNIPKGDKLYKVLRNLKLMK
ncbi:stage V sporulation B domain protein [[Clostridium] sordellii ATCC 9714]|nr:stage V sporulation B domain protein [[Clostridium] sordellii ATCC 9714] [Paeniclostridium sordellii ATCC 9714]